MKHRLRIAVALPLLSALVLSACAPSSNEAAGGAASGEPVRDGSFTIATNGQEFDCIAPALNASLNGAIAARAFSDSPVWQNPESGEIEPWLVEKWDISPDGTTYTFTLKDGVTFTDGSAWDAAALQANFDWIVKPETKSPMAASYIAPYEDSEVIDDRTLEVHLSTPYSAFLRVLAQGFFGVVSPKQIAEDPDSICTKPIGTGPFSIVEWTKSQGVTFTRNDDYQWGPPGSHQGPAYLKNYEILFIAEDSTRFSALQSGQVDAIDWVPAQNLDTAKSDPRLDVVQLTTSGHPFSWYLNASRPPFDDVRVRQALLHGIDRQGIVDSVLFGQYEASKGYLTSSTYQYSENQIDYDVAGANALLDEAGWTTRDDAGYRTKDGKRLTAVLPTSNTIAYRVQIAEQIQAAAKKDLGLEITIEYPAAQELSDRSRSGDYDIASGIWGTNTPDILYLKYATDGITTPERIGLNNSRFSDAQLDDLVQRARETTDADEQADLYAQAQQRLVEQVPAVPLFDDQRVVAYDREKVQGLRLDVAYPAVLPHDIWTAGDR